MEPFITREEEINKNLIGVAECLVNQNKHVTKLGFAHVDDSTAMSQDLANEAYYKCVRLETAFAKDGDMLLKTGHGHGGFIRGKSLKSSPGGKTTVSFAVYPITAKHNLRYPADDASTPGSPYKREYANLLLSNSVKLKVSWNGDVVLGWVPTEEDSLNLREGCADAMPVSWKYGFDVHVDSVIEKEDNFACSADGSFERIGNDFKLEKGQKVGMAVFSQRHTKPTRATITAGNQFPVDSHEFGESDIQRVYGEPHQVNVYTGEITYVGAKHIEYNMNSFTGCSGAVVFLLDMEQPASVGKSNWGKAVAVHAGGRPTLRNRNFGFLINEYPCLKNCSPRIANDKDARPSHV